MLVLAGGIWHYDGLPGRFSAEARVVCSAATQDDPAARCFGRRPEAGLCRFGANTGAATSADFLLWGDSHALADMPAVEVAALRAGRSGVFAGQTDCAPLLGLDTSHGSPADRCSNFNAAVIAALRARKDMPLVILAGRWALTAEGTRVLGERRPPVLFVRAGNAPATVEGNFALFRSALTDTVAAIRATGRKLVLLGDVPEIGWECAGSPRRLSALGKTFATAANRRRRLTARGAREPGTSGGGRTSRSRVHTSDAIVLPFSVPSLVLEQGRPLYRDDNHLSRFGALAIVAPLLTKRLWP